jgi:hypothetical protein
MSHLRVFHCNLCGRDDILNDVVSDTPLICERSHLLDEHCTIIPCLGCWQELIRDREDREQLRSML